MVVDDERLILATVKALFKHHGLQVATANSGQECLEELDAGFKGVILMDVMMPQMDGWETIKEIVDRGLLEGNVIVMLTALDAPDQKMEGLQEYVTDYITKPFDSEELIATVKGYLEYL
jgi:DNA-binding response OmpR family regulator